MFDFGGGEGLDVFVEELKMFFLVFWAKTNLLWLGALCTQVFHETGLTFVSSPPIFLKRTLRIAIFLDTMVVPFAVAG